jgi:hypothetical protein
MHPGWCVKRVGFAVSRIKFSIPLSVHYYSLGPAAPASQISDENSEMVASSIVKYHYTVNYSSEFLKKTIILKSISLSNSDMNIVYSSSS